MPFSSHPRPEVLKSLANAKPVPFWLDDKARPEPAPALTGSITADLVVIGAGFSGLWTALLAKESDPSLDVVLIEAGEVASGASGRNGGFADHCLTHTFGNGLERWPEELSTLVRMGYENLNAIEETVKRYQIDCDFQRTGEMVVATEGARRSRPLRPKATMVRTGTYPGAGQFAHVPGRAVRSGPGHAQPGSTGLGLEEGLPGERCPLV